jgi:hypothetical protein
MRAFLNIVIRAVLLLSLPTTASVGKLSHCDVLYTLRAEYLTSSPTVRDKSTIGRELLGVDITSKEVRISSFLHHIINGDARVLRIVSHD